MKKITLLSLIVFTITSQAQNKLLSSIIENYNGSSWQKYAGHNYEYDSNNNLISETFLFWNYVEWVIEDKTNYTYDANNKVTEVLYQEWNNVTKQFEKPQKEIYTYSDYVGGKITEKLFQKWENSQWVNDGKFIFGYDSNNLLNAGLGHSWDGTQWILDDREYFFYSGNQLTSSITETRVGVPFQKDYRSTYSYYNNKITSYQGENWIDGAWSLRVNTAYLFDANGNRIRNTSIYSSTTYKEEYDYDNLSLMASFAHPFKDKTGLDYLFESFPYVNKLLSSTQYYFDTVSSSFKPNSRTTYNYNNNIVLSNEQLEIPKTTILVFPNPTTSKLNLAISNDLTIDKIVIVDSNGKMVMQQNQNVSQVNVENLAAGLYIIEAFSGKDKFTSKFVKK
ncbi:T9SS type A sorting domain-containing protein [Flavobacterium nackdongense]|uniref:T9SS type A sorting domain-containing protein n=1 Tax=Flavobacterium nackdongense TaxID=2547394 RepID=A0A4P6YH54_9FLAO|nr:T9SS type A sorting domain-containing protein [Flavobacterium nackdongense]QBN19910.1 T9SS type A sorting domain-containing protein [Flavobacterium nackdongense]